MLYTPSWSTLHHDALLSTMIHVIKLVMVIVIIIVIFIIIIIIINIIVIMLLLSLFLHLFVIFMYIKCVNMIVNWIFGQKPNKLFELELSYS